MLKKKKKVALNTIDGLSLSFPTTKTGQTEEEDKGELSIAVLQVSM